MQVVAGVVRGEQPLRILRVACHQVEINHGVEVARRANPFVHCLAIGFGRCAGVIELRADKRQKRSAEHLDAVRASASDDLFVRGDDAPHQRVVLGLRDFGGSRQHADVVDALQHNQVANAGLREHIVVKSGQRIRPEAIEQQAIAADAVIEHSDGLGRVGGLQAPSQEVGPAIVAVGRSAVAVGDGIPECDHGGGAAGRLHVHAGDEIPVVHFLCFRELFRGNKVAMSVIGRRAGTGMAGLRRGRLRQMERDGQIRERSDGVRNGIGKVVGAGGNNHIQPPGECQRLAALRDDLSGSG